MKDLMVGLFAFISLSVYAATGFTNPRLYAAIGAVSIASVYCFAAYVNENK